jgi:hypothetical protein
MSLQGFHLAHRTRHLAHTELGNHLAHAESEICSLANLHRTMLLPNPNGVWATATRQLRQNLTTSPRASSSGWHTRHPAHSDWASNHEG